MTPACLLGEISLKSSIISWKRVKLVNHSDHSNTTEMGQRQGGLVRYLSVTRNQPPLLKANLKRSLNGRTLSHPQTLRKSCRSQGAQHCQDAHRVSILLLVSVTSFLSRGRCVPEIWPIMAWLPPALVNSLGNTRCPSSHP